MYSNTSRFVKFGACAFGVFSIFAVLGRGVSLFFEYQNTIHHAEQQIAEYQKELLVQSAKLSDQDSVQTGTLSVGQTVANLQTRCLRGEDASADLRLYFPDGSVLWYRPEDASGEWICAAEPSGQSAAVWFYEQDGRIQACASAVFNESSRTFSQLRVGVLEVPF